VLAWSRARQPFASLPASTGTRGVDPNRPIVGGQSAGWVRQRLPVVHPSAVFAPPRLPADARFAHSRRAPWWGRPPPE